MTKTPRENWNIDPASKTLLDLVNKRLSLNNKSAVMRMAIAALARDVIGEDRTNKILDQA